MRAALAALAVVAVAGPSTAHAASQPLDAYRIDAGGKKLEQLAKLGYDLTEARQGNRAVVVATKAEAAGLRAKGFAPALVRDAQGRTERQRAEAQAAQTGYRVWRPYSSTAYDQNGKETENLVQELKRLHAENPLTTKLENLGNTLQGVPIYAMKVTRNAASVPDGQRPAVLYSSTQHAREWLSTDTNRRMMRMLIDNYGKTGGARAIDGKTIPGVTSEELTNLVDTREMWFVLVCNPDGYDYTFTAPENRLWRKNLRDNDGDGKITPLDGVDPNRNFATHWGYDNEGSSDDPTSETYRGTAPQSEPETRALDGLMKRVNFEFNSNYHTAAALLLYPFGWQMDTHAADEPVFRSLLGTDEQPAVDGFNPGTGSELYITNGDTNDHAYTQYGTASFTPELLPGDPDVEGGDGQFVFQDVPADAETEFERQVQYGLDLARSAPDPAHPVSHLGVEAPPFELDAFDVSYGDPQVVQVNAKRDLGAVTVHWRVADGPEQTAATGEWQGGERYGDVGDRWYHRVRGTVTGTAAGDSVRVWFTAGGHESKSFTYSVASDSGADVLVIADENYSGTVPVYTDPSKPAYLDRYTSSLDALGVAHDVWDVDARGLKAPSALGVLSHYKAVLWYTGDDIVTRVGGQPGGSGANVVANDLQYAVRDFLNEGGKLLLTGNESGKQYFDAYEYPQYGGTVPTATGFCDGDPDVVDTCIPLSNDFFQYYLGGYVYATGSGLAEDGSVFGTVGTGDPFTGVSYPVLLGGGTDPDALDGPGSALVTSSLLDPAEFPQFGSSTGVLDWARPGASPYDPFTGSSYMYGGMSDKAYKRLATTVDLTGKTGGGLDFMASYDTEPGWDFLFVEAHTVGQDDWTTLPITDDGGTELTSDDTGDSCNGDGGSWDEIHPFTTHYQTVETDGCAPTGTTGSWHALTGNSGGWQHLNADLSAFDGKQVEVSISYVQDWATSGLGVFVDDARTSAGGATLTQTSFETDDLSPWTVPGPPAGTLINSADWARTGAAFDEASGVRTTDTLWLTFGLEGLGDTDRQDALRRGLGDLGVDVAAPDDGSGATSDGGSGGDGAVLGGSVSGGAGRGATVSKVRMGKRALRASKRNRSVYLKVKCGATSGGKCRGSIKLWRGKQAIAGRAFAIKADAWTTVRLHLSAKAYRRLVRKHALAVQVRVSSRGSDGVLRRSTGRITLRAPKAKH